MRRAVVMVTTSLVMAMGCSADPGQPSIIIIREPAPAPTVPDGTSTPPSAPDPCASLRPDGYVNGDRCGLEAPGEAACATPPIAGFVYACIDEGAAPTQPDITNCFAVSRANGVTRVQCPKASCVVFNDGRCVTTNFRRGLACPDEGLKLNVAPPVTNISGTPVACKPTGFWDVGTAHGPAYCCP